MRSVMKGLHGINYESTVILEQQVNILLKTDAFLELSKISGYIFFLSNGSCRVLKYPSFVKIYEI
jgi:hypothetical protein